MVSEGEPKASATRNGATYREGNSLGYLAFLEAHALGRIEEDRPLFVEVQQFGPLRVAGIEAVRRLLQ